MEKTEMMKRFEEDTGKHSVILKFMAGGQALDQKSYPKIGPYDYNIDYIAWLEAKATAYDRLMSGGKKTLKEWANLFGRAVAMEAGGVFQSYNNVPERCDSAGYWYCDEHAEDFEDELFIIPNDVVDYTGSWQDSLTLPDGWEEA